MDCGSFIKIGVSNDPDRREKQIPYKVMQYYCKRQILRLPLNLTPLL